MKRAMERSAREPKEQARGSAGPSKISEPGLVPILTPKLPRENSPVNEEMNNPGLQLALEQAQNNPEVPEHNRGNLSVNVEPVNVAGESQGSASGSVRHSSYYETTTSRARMNILSNKPPALIELDEEREDEDLKDRFNGNREAYTEYLALKGKPVILDKGFDAIFLNHGLISYMVREHGWTNFCTHRSENSNWELLREFYANINQTSETTWVRGKVIKIDSETLNRFLGTGGQAGELTFEQLNRVAISQAEREVVRKIAWSVCSGPPQFIRGPTFEDKQVKVELKPSMDFYFVKLKPVSHTHRISGVSLRGLSNILLGKKLNVGEIIKKTMLKVKRGVLCHPNLIRRLCDEAKVDFTAFPTERAIALGRPIPLIPWPAGNEYRYQLVDPPADEPILDQGGDESQAPPLQPRQRQPRAPRGRKRQRDDDFTVNQGAANKQKEATTQAVPGTSAQPAQSQGKHFTEISQTFLTMQEWQERQLNAWNETWLKEKEMEIAARDREIAARDRERETHKELEERRIQAAHERDKLRMQHEKERDQKNQEFLTNLITSLLNPTQQTRLSTPTIPVIPAQQPSSSSDTQPEDPSRIRRTSAKVEM